MDGVLILDKPQEISSHDAVREIRRLCGIKRVGHLGTLDPLATGVLPLVVGRTTRLSQFFLGHDRAYEAEIRFGYATDTYDARGERVTEPADVELTADQIEALLKDFRGRFAQTPPPVSAKKIGGVPAYKLARRKQPVRLEPVEIEVYEFSLLAVEGSLARVRVRCSAGTYVRSLAHDLGRRLGTGAHVESLRRMAMGAFTIEGAHTLAELEVLRSENRLDEAFGEAEKVLPAIPVERGDEATAALIQHGRDFPKSLPVYRRALRGAKRVKAVDPQGRLIAIGEARLPLVYHPIVVL